jgi:hypothetical protein
MDFGHIDIYMCQILLINLNCVCVCKFIILSLSLVFFALRLLVIHNISYILNLMFASIFESSLPLCSQTLASVQMSFSSSESTMVQSGGGAFSLGLNYRSALFS